MQHYMDKYVVCPFYSQEEELKLRCEGHCKGTRIHLCFDCKERKKAYKKRFCNSMEGYTQCLLQQAIMQQYEEKEESQ